MIKITRVTNTDEDVYKVHGHVNHTQLSQFEKLSLWLSAS